MNISSSPNAQSIHLTQGRAPAVTTPAPTAEQVAKAEETRDAFADFFGKTFYGQMMKSMRQTVGKPAYFDGGRAEEVFRAQLDQTLADHMSEGQGAAIAEGAFRQQFPDLAKVLDSQDRHAGSPQAGLAQLETLRRR